MGGKRPRKSLLESRLKKRENKSRSSYFFLVRALAVVDCGKSLANINIVSALSSYSMSFLVPFLRFSSWNSSETYNAYRVTNGDRRACDGTWARLMALQRNFQRTETHGRNGRRDANLSVGKRPKIMRSDQIKNSLVEAISSRASVPSP